MVQDSQERKKGLLAAYLVDDFEAELQRRDITLDTANAVFEAIVAALTPKPSTRVGEGSPAKNESKAVLLLWSKLRADRLSESTASRVIAVGLNKNAKQFIKSIYQTIHNA